VEEPQNSDLSADDEAQLRELSNDLVAAMQRPWQPRCIVRAFATPAKPPLFTLTIRTWANLDAIESPLLQGTLPPTVEEIERAIAAFGWPSEIEELTSEEALVMAEEMRLAIRDGFSTSLEMAPPDGSAERDLQHGFGSWLPVLSCLVTQCGMSARRALDFPVNQAFAIIAGMRHNQGWKAVGVPYALRELATGNS
jgi:hypothetical protein